MPRTPRASVGGICYHVLNRGNGRDTVFHKDGDYDAFLKAIGHACVEVQMPVSAWCLMPNHFHLVVRPIEDGDLSRWMHWLQNAHVRRYHKQHKSSGHVWQGRFKSFPIEQNEHLLTVMRYVERNPVRAGLVTSARKWKWSSTRYWDDPEGRPTWWRHAPVERPEDWLGWVDQALTADELARLRRSVNRGTPFGSVDWAIKTAARLGLEATLRSRGRPRKVDVPVKKEVIK